MVTKIEWKTANKRNGAATSAQVIELELNAVGNIKVRDESIHIEDPYTLLEGFIKVYSKV